MVALSIIHHNFYQLLMEERVARLLPLVLGEIGEINDILQRIPAPISSLEIIPSQNLHLLLYQLLTHNILASLNTTHSAAHLYRISIINQNAPGKQLL